MVFFDAREKLQAHIPQTMIFRAVSVNKKRNEHNGIPHPNQFQCIPSGKLT